MPNENLAAARAAAQARRKKKTKTKTKGGRAGGRNFVTATAAAAAAAEKTAAEAEAAEARSASGRHARKARTDGVAEVKPTSADLAACAEAKLELPVEQVALQKMRALKHGWVCALWVEGRLHVYLAGGLEDDNRWIMEVMAGGGKESEQVRVDKDRLESQPMVVMKVRGRRGRAGGRRRG